MPLVTGYVKKIHDRQVNTKRGPSTVYSVLMDNEWYNAGFNRPACSENDEVTIDYEDDNYGHKINSIVITGGTGVSSGSVPVSQGNGSTVRRKTFPINLDDPDISQIRRSAGHLTATLFEPYLTRKALDAETEYLTLDDLQNMRKVATFWEAYFSGQEVEIEELPRIGAAFDEDD